MKYKNISNQTQVLIGFGVVRKNGIIETGKRINNPNFELISEEKKVAKSQPARRQPRGRGKRNA